MSTFRWLRRIAATAGALALLSTSACGSSPTAEPPKTGDPQWDAIVAAAYEEGGVNVYNVASESQNQRLADAFEAKYPGIKLTITRGATELAGRVSAELANGTDGADALIFSDPNWFIDHEADLAALAGPSTEGWRDDWWVIPGKSVQATALPWSMIVWNTNKFPDGFDGYDDLLDPAVKGQLGTRSEISPSVAGYLDHLETRLGQDFLTGLAAQNPKFYPSALPLIQAVASGEIGVANLGAPAAVVELKEAGAPIDVVYPEPGFAYTLGGAAFTTSKRPNAGLVFMDFFMSEEGQLAYNGDGRGAAGREGVQGALSVEGYTMQDSKKFSDPAVIAEWNRKFDSYFRGCERFTH